VADYRPDLAAAVVAVLPQPRVLPAPLYQAHRAICGGGGSARRTAAWASPGWAAIAVNRSLDTRSPVMRRVRLSDLLPPVGDNQRDQGTGPATEANTLRVNRDLRPLALQAGRMLPAFAARLRPEDVEEFTARPAAVDYVDGLVELMGRVKDLTLDDHLKFMPHPAEIEMRLVWRRGIDENVMDGAAAAIHYMTQALYQGRLGHWPAMCPVPGGAKLAWSMPQLIEVVEPHLDVLEQKAAEQEDNAAREPRLPWPHEVQ
jgi:hypothetical protein